MQQVPLRSAAGAAAAPSSDARLILESFFKGAEEWLYTEIEKGNTRSDDSSIGQAEQSCLPSGTLSRVEHLQPAAVDKPTQSSCAGEDFSLGDNITAANDCGLAGEGVKTSDTLKELHTNTGGAPPPPPGCVVQDASWLSPKSSLNGITVVNSGAATPLPTMSCLNGITVVKSGAAGGEYDPRNVLPCHTRLMNDLRDSQIEAASETQQTVVQAGKAPRRAKKCEHDKMRRGCKLCNKQAVCEHDRFRRSGA